MKSLEYIAGYFDGEGTVGIEKAHRGHSIRVSIANTYLPALLEIKEQFGGSVTAHNRRLSLSHRKAYTWRIGGQAAREFLETIIPLLDEKRAQAELALTLPQRISGGHRPDNDTKLFGMQEAVYLEVRRMKHVEHCLEQGRAVPCSE